MRTRPATAAIAEAFGKDFPKIKTSYVRAQTGALYNKISTERAAGRFDVDILQFSDLAPALDFQKKGGYEIYHSPEAGGYKPEYLSNPAGAFFWTGVTFGGLAYSTAKVKAEEAPKSWKDLLDPKWRNAMSCKISSSGIQFVQWYELRKLYGDEYWKEFAKQRPRGFDSRVQLFDRLAKGDDKVCALAEYAAMCCTRRRVRRSSSSRPPTACRRRRCWSASSTRRRIRRSRSSSSTGRCRAAGRRFYQSNPHLIYGSLRTDAPPMPTGKRLADFKLLFPTDYADYLGSRDKFTKDWNGMLGAVGSAKHAGARAAVAGPVGTGHRRLRRRRRRGRPRPLPDLLSHAGGA